MGSKIGRPKIDNPKNRIIKCKVTEDMYNRINAFKKQTGMTLTQMITDGLDMVICGKEKSD